MKASQEDGSQVRTMHMMRSAMRAFSKLSFLKPSSSLAGTLTKLLRTSEVSRMHLA